MCPICSDLVHLKPTIAVSIAQKLLAVTWRINKLVSSIKVMLSVSKYLTVWRQHERVFAELVSFDCQSLDQCLDISMDCSTQVHSVFPNITTACSNTQGSIKEPVFCYLRHVLLCLSLCHCSNTVCCLLCKMISSELSNKLDQKTKRKKVSLFVPCVKLKNLLINNIYGYSS